MIKIKKITFYKQPQFGLMIYVTPYILGEREIIISLPFLDINFKQINY